jgi:hypothetical protein
MFHKGVNSMNGTAAFQKGTGANRENRGLPGPNREPKVLQPGTIQ